MHTVTGTLRVTVVDAKDLNSDQYGKVDPYCKLSFPGFLCNRHYTTKAHKRGGNAPIWEESHIFHLSGTKFNSKLKIALYDRAIFKKQPLGRVKIYLAELLEHVGEKYYYPIIEDRPDFRTAGFLGLLVELFDEERKGKSAPLTQASEPVAYVPEQRSQSTEQHPQSTEQHPQSTIDNPQSTTEYPQSGTEHPQMYPQTYPQMQNQMHQTEMDSHTKQVPTSTDTQTHQPQSTQSMHPTTQ